MREICTISSADGYDMKKVKEFKCENLTNSQISNNTIHEYNYDKHEHNDQ